MQQNIGGRLIERCLLRRIGGDQAGEKTVAQILQQQKALRQILCQTLRRRQAQTRQMPRNRQKLRRIVALAGRRIHQNGGFLAQPKPVIAAIRGVARQKGPPRRAPAGALQKLP